MVIAKKDTRARRQKIALALLAVLMLAAAALFYVKLGDSVKAGVELYKRAVPDDEAVFAAADGVRAEAGYTALGDISDEFIEELLHEEDRRFYWHFGVDPVGVLRALVVNLQKGKVVQGASTITMQLARNLFFTQERTAVRKVAEVLAAFRLERLLEKDEILELYCNESYFGEDCYGIRAASEYYYNVEPSELNEEQSAALVYTLRAPSVYHPEPYSAQAA